MCGCPELERSPLGRVITIQISASGRWHLAVWIRDAIAPIMPSVE